MIPQRGLHSEFEHADDSTGLMLWRVTNAWQAAQRRALKPFKLTHVQFVLLASLTWLGADIPVTQQALARHAGTDPMMTSQVLRTLETAALIERSPHPDDRRARLLSVTPVGRELANRAIRAVETCDRDFFDTLGDDRVQLTRMLAKLI
jgi:DNA-binding MarR family transcriptional regulator